jgi:hypothetical protein
MGFTRDYCQLNWVRNIITTRKTIEQDNLHGYSISMLLYSDNIF